MKYFQISVIYTKPLKGHRRKATDHIVRPKETRHVVRAKSKQEALNIAKKYGIAYPFNSPFVEKRFARELNINFSFIRQLIERRRKGIGGKIWYEDKNGKLQKET